MFKYFSFALALLFSFAASANYQSDLIKGKKGPSDANVQWTLADWLSQKNQARLMDQWLAMHRSGSWFDLTLSGAGQQFKLKTDNGTSVVSSDKSAQTFQADMYLSILNLNGEYKKTNDGNESYGGAAGLRLLGGSSQTTNLVARYGWRRLTNLVSQERWENQYAEGALQLYIVQGCGLNGQYRYYFPATSNQGTRLEGHKVTAGVFFELSIFRVYADYFQEPIQLSAGGLVTRTVADGYEGGVKLFF